ncbi:MAG: efflux RND transporter permease subunit [Bacteroidota bacterium]
MKERKFKLTEYAVDNQVTIYILTAVLIIAGIFAYQATPKEQFPEVTFPFYNVTTIYPGTSPEDIENLVTKPIEKKLKGVDGIKTIESKSLQDVSTIFIEFETNVPEQKASNDVKDAVDEAKSDLPDGILNDPEVMEINVSEIPILYINLSGDLSLPKIKGYAEDLQDEIEGLQEVSRADIVGALEREVQIKVDMHKMQSAGITFSQIAERVAQENMTISGGEVQVDDMNRNMRVVGEFDDPVNVKNILLKDGVYLKDIADVVDGFADRENYARLKGQDVITLNVIKKSGQNLINAVDKIKVILEDFQEGEAPDNLEITTTGDQSTMTRNSVSDLFNTIILGFLVVVIVLMFFMGVDNAAFVGVAIPLSMLLAFIVLPVIDFTMNMVVLMSFILVLGIVVDNSIVVVENIYRHFMHTPNLSIQRASKIGVAEVAGPVFSGTLTTMAPFIPLAFWPGIMGKFMMYIPITLIITLSASMIVAYTMNPVFAVSFMKYRPIGEKDPVNKRKLLFWTLGVILAAAIFYFAGVIFMGNLLIFGLLVYYLVQFVLKGAIKSFQHRVLPKMKNAYRSTLHFLLHGYRPYITLAGTLFLLVFTFWLMGVAGPKVIMFPPNEPSDIYVYLTMPEGTRIEKTNEVVKELEQQVFEIVGTDNADVESIITNVAENAGEDIFDRATLPHLAKITVSFVEYKYRTGPSTSTYLNELRDKLKGMAGAEIVVGQNENGPPTGKPINIEISGDEYTTLIDLEERLFDYIKTLNIQGIEELKSDLSISKPEIEVQIDRAKANKYGITTAYIGSTLRTAIYGSEVSTFREGDDEYSIQLRLDDGYRYDLASLMNMRLMVPGGPKGVRMIPISAVADISFTTSYGGIIHKDNDRVITLASNVLEGYNANEIVNRLRNEVVKLDIPDGYSIEFTGEQEEQEESGQFLVFAFIAAFLLIFIILVMQFNSLSKPLIILCQVIFSTIGVLLGFIIFGLDFSVILTGMGIIAVAGIVVKNAIILIDYSDLLIERGGRIRENIVEAGTTRLTPVLLTAASTIFGLLPLAIGMNINFVTLFTEFDPAIFFGGDNSVFWGPLAWTIIFGLAFATFLTLVVVPSMYFIVKERGVKGQRKRSLKASS